MATRYIRGGRWTTLQAALGVAALVSAAAVVWDLTTGGFRVEIFGIRVSSSEPFTPFRMCVICAGVVLWLKDRTTAGAAARTLSARQAAVVAAAASGAVALLAIACGSFVVGGADSYGYVSQASLWASGRLIFYDSFARFSTIVGRAVAPLGYDLAPVSGAYVPTYPPGLPIAMAMASKVGGMTAMYFVVPLLAGLAVWLTYVLGAHVADAGVGMIASVLFAFSPIFLSQAFQPLSDVPATAWWLLAWVFALTPGIRGALFTGAAAAAAVLTRPNLVLLGLVLVVVVATERPRFRRMIAFALALAPACGAIAWLNTYWYGSPFRSGYGSFADLYAWDNVVGNVRNYGKWLVELHSPGILVAFLAPWLTRGRAFALMLTFVAVVLLSYVFYFVYDNWPFLRFLLPAIPLLFILVAAVIVGLLERVPAEFRRAFMFVLCLLVPCAYLEKADRLRIFDNRRAERRYAAVGEFVKWRLPPNAVVVTVMESGSLRFYGARPTLRWDYIPPTQLDAVLETMRAHGYERYILLESSEEDEFRTRFGGSSVVGRVDWPPTIEYFGPSDVRIYAVEDRAQYVAGRRNLPRAVPSE